LGGPWLHVSPKGSTCPSGEVEMRREGSGTFDNAEGLGRGGEMSPETPNVPETSPQGSGEIEFVIRALSG
jgi:hypothetical protein